MRWWQMLITWQFTAHPRVTTTPPEAPKQATMPPLPIDPTNLPPDPDSVVFPWDTAKHAFHNTRVIADQCGLSLEQKDILCQCIYQESTFLNYRAPGVPTTCHNKDKNGVVWSTDWGICQVNDWFHIGTGKDFPSVDYVMANPDVVVRWMAMILKRTGALQPWSSYASGAYKKWAVPSSPLWVLRS
jgi:hypothetical protein